MHDVQFHFWGGWGLGVPQLGQKLASIELSCKQELQFQVGAVLEDNNCWSCWIPNLLFPKEIKEEYSMLLNKNC